jgi:hypothetical protein
MARKQVARFRVCSMRRFHSTRSWRRERATCLRISVVCMTKIVTTNRKAENSQLPSVAVFNILAA